MASKKPNRARRHRLNPGRRPVVVNKHAQAMSTSAPVARVTTPEAAPQRKLRPAGWNAEIAAKRAKARADKIAARKAARGRRMFRGSSLRGFPASINRRTGKPHEHARAKARRRGTAA